MRFNRYFKDNKWMPYAIAGCIIVLFYLLASHINYLFIGIESFLWFISPVVGGAIIAYILDPLVKVFETKVFAGLYKKPGARRILSVWITLILVLIFVALFMVALVPQIAQSLRSFVSNFDYYAQSLQNLLDSMSREFKSGFVDISNITQLLEKEIGKIVDYLQDNLGNIVNKSLNVGKSIANTGISCILAIYMLLDKSRLQRAWKRFLQALLPDKRYTEVAAFWNRCNNILVRYIAGDLLDGLIVGVANFIFMTLAGMDFAVLVSVIVGITNLAPTFGPLVGAIVGALFLVFVNPWYALWFLLFTIVLQTLDGYIIKPKLFGNTLGISALWILISIIVLGRMFGVAGILLAIPVAAILDIVYKELILGRLERRKEEKRIAIAEAEAKRSADEAAKKAAKEAIKAVVKKDSLSAGSEEEREKLSEDPELTSKSKASENNDI
ncbi:MAG: AI-2E family transporter [Lachnospiraceae bacterium]|nr:AI-2E family transporter [Lachnospiraceae bacterium]